MLVGALLVVLCVLGVAALVSSVGDRSPVLVAARRIPEGATITRGDLRQGEIGAEGVATIAVGEVDRVVGRRATAAIAEGDLISSGKLRSGPALGEGSAVVGVELGPGELPVAGLEVGARVAVVDGGGTDAASGAPPEGTVLATGEVFAVGVASVATGKVAVSVVLAEDEAPRVAAAAGAERVRLVLLGGRGG